MPDDMTQDDDLEFTGKPSSFKEIVMAHLTRITQLSSIELRGGYYSVFVTKSGEEKESYVPDSRAALENAIYCLAQLLIPKFDDKTKKAFIKFKDELVALKQEFLKATKIDDKEVLGEAYYSDVEKKLLEEYKIQKCELYREFFTILSLLLAKHKYFEIGGAVF